MTLSVPKIPERLVSIDLTQKEAARLLTQQGFLRWAEGKPLQACDFKTEQTAS